MTAPRKSEPIPPFIAWMSRHGIKVIGALILLEFLLHGWMQYSAKRNAEREKEPVAPSAAASAYD